MATCHSDTTKDAGTFPDGVYQCCRSVIGPQSETQQMDGVGGVPFHTHDTDHSIEITAIVMTGLAVIAVIGAAVFIYVKRLQQQQSLRGAMQQWEQHQTSQPEPMHQDAQWEQIPIAPVVSGTIPMTEPPSYPK